MLGTYFFSYPKKHDIRSKEVFIFSLQKMKVHLTHLHFIAQKMNDMR